MRHAVDGLWSNSFAKVKIDGGRIQFGEKADDKALRLDIALGFVRIKVIPRQDGKEDEIPADLVLRRDLVKLNAADGVFRSANYVFLKIFREIENIVLYLFYRRPIAAGYARVLVLLRRETKSQSANRST